MKILKKIAAILIVAVTMVSFISCNKDDKEASANTNAPAMVGGIIDIQCYLGNYTYSNGSGSLSLEDDNHAPINASFTIDGTRMSLTLQGGSYTLTKK